jgi:hypothetical protein
LLLQGRIVFGCVRVEVHGFHKIPTLKRIELLDRTVLFFTIRNLCRRHD